MSTAESRKENVYLAMLAERAERYEDMVELMNKVMITVDAEGITVEERKLLSLAYKKATEAKRSAWRAISSIAQKKEGSGNEDHVAIIKNYRSNIETDIRKICDEILNLLDSHLVPAAATAESKVYYLKMKGDYQRYLAEVMTGTEREEAAENTLLTYKSAQDIAVSELAPTDPLRLGLALNFSVFYYEILNLTDNALKLAKQAFDEAAADLDSLDEKTYKDSTLMMQLLQDNLTLWNSDPTKEGAAGAEETSDLETTEGQL